MAPNAPAVSELMVTDHFPVLGATTVQHHILHRPKLTQVTRAMLQ